MRMTMVPANNHHGFTNFLAKFLYTQRQLASHSRNPACIQQLASASRAARCKLSGAISTLSLRLSDRVKKEMYFTWAIDFVFWYGLLLGTVYS